MITWTIARRYLLSQTGRPTARSIIAIVGVMLMVAQWIVMVSIQSGFIDTYQDHVLGANPHVRVTKYSMYFGDYPDVQRRVNEDKDVVESSPYLLMQMQLSGQNIRQRPSVWVRGIDVDLMPKMTNIGDLVTDGSLEDIRYAAPEKTAENTGDNTGEIDLDALFEESEEITMGKVALGSLLAKQVRVEVGDVVRLNSPLSNFHVAGAQEAAPRGPAVAVFEVAAILNTGFHDFDSKLVVMDYRGLQAWNGRGDVVSGVEVQVKDPYEAREVAARLQDQLGVARYQVMDWTEIHQNLFGALKRQKLIFAIVASAGVLVSSFLVLSVLIMIILEKRKDIGILKSLGARKRDISRIFMLQGLAIGVIGSFAGLAVGWGLCLLIRTIKIDVAFEVYRLHHLPVSMRPSDFLVGWLAGVLLCFIATLYPVYRAASVDPLEAIRK